MKNEKQLFMVDYRIDELDAVAEKIYTVLPQCSILTFTGSLGAGKTTLIKALLKRCGVEANVVSPTFAYLNVYTNKQGKQFNHFDLYRLHSVTEFLESGFDEYLFLPQSYTLIEWPEKIRKLLPITNTCHLMLDYIDEQSRRLVIFKYM